MTKTSRRLTSPAFVRNAQPILTVLRRVLGDRRGDVLEIGSGPGQHIAAFAAALPGLTWWPSDPDPANRDSIVEWRDECGCTNMMPPVALDAATSDWPLGRPGCPPDSDLTALLCINVVHIAPWSVAEGVMRGAGRHLAPDGRLILYGPYSRDGVHTAPSNAAFDAALKVQDPAWGVRDMTDMAALADSRGLEMAETIAMPSNNFCLILERRGRQGDPVRRRGR